MQQDKRLLVAYFIVAVVVVGLLMGVCAYDALQDLNGSTPNAQALPNERARLLPG